MRRLLASGITAAVVVAAGAGLAARQQAPAKEQTVVLKGKAPVSTETLAVKLPRPVERDLPSGLHVMVLEDHRAPQIAFQLVVRGAGGYYDPAGKAGLASLTATMMREGTASRNTQQIAEALETMASTVTVSSAPSSILASVSGSSLTENFAKTFEMATDILLHPSFPQDELDRLKTRTKAQLLQQRSSPGFVGNELISRVLFGDHPAGRVSMTPEAVDAVTRDDMVAFHKARYIPDHALLAIAGDVSAAEVERATTLLAGWTKAGTPLAPVTDPADAGPAKVYLVARPNSVQTSLFVGAQGIRRTDPSYDTLSVMNAVIGGGPTGRLFTHLREEKGYTYGAYSSLNAGPFRGGWLAQTDVRTDVTEPALTDLIAEITRMRDEPVPQKEFDDRRRGMIASFALGLENPAVMLNNHVTRWIYGLPADYWDHLPQRTMAVTQPAVQAAAREYLAPARLQIVAVGDPDKIAPILAKFGTVETYDTNGKRVTP